MLIGTQYFRPPNPEPETWDTDFAQIRDLGMSIVRCWMYWRIVEPREGEWNWEAYDRFMDLAAQHGLKAVIQLVPECQPQWFLRRHRDLWPVEESGREYGQKGYGMVTPGGYPGIFYDQPPAAEGFARFYQAAAERYARHPAMYVWDVWNEIQPHGGLFSYDAVTEQRWHDYLAQRYGTIEALNEELLSQFIAFDEIDLVRPQARYSGTTHWHMLLADFRSWRLTQEMKRRYDLIRRIDATHAIVAHAAATPMVGGHDDLQLAAVVDSYGTSQYLTEYRIGEGYDYIYANLYFAVTRSLTNGKPWWLSEHSGGPVFYHYGHTNKTPAEIRSNLLMPMAQGAEAALFWQYRNERLGEEASSWGLVSFDGSTNRRTDAVQEITAAIAREAANLKQVARPAAGINILMDYRSSRLECVSSAWEKQAIVAVGDAEGFYTGCLEAGLSPDLLHADHLPSQEIPDSCRLLILAMRTGLTDKVIEKLLAWVQAGGTLIATAYLGMFDDQNYVPRILPREPWSSAFGVRVVSRDYPAELQLIPSSDGLPPLAGHWTLENLRVVSDAEVMATCNGQPAITRRAYGQGQLWYIASCPGYPKDRTSLLAWLRHWASSVGIHPWYQAAPAVLGERRVGTTTTYLYLTNSKHQNETVTLIGSRELSGDLTCVLSGNALGHLPADGRCEVSVSSRETLWLKVSR